MRFDLAWNLRLLPEGVPDVKLFDGDVQDHSLLDMSGSAVAGTASPPKAMTIQRITPGMISFRRNCHALPHVSQSAGSSKLETRAVLKFIGGTVGVIFLIGLLVVIGILALILQPVLRCRAARRLVHVSALDELRVRPRTEC